MEGLCLILSGPSRRGKWECLRNRREVPSMDSRNGENFRQPTFRTLLTPIRTLPRRGARLRVRLKKPPTRSLFTEKDCTVNSCGVVWMPELGVTRMLLSGRLGKPPPTNPTLNAAREVVALMTRPYGILPIAYRVIRSPSRVLSLSPMGPRLATDMVGLFRVGIGRLLVDKGSVFNVRRVRKAWTRPCENSTSYYQACPRSPIS